MKIKLIYIFFSKNQGRNQPNSPRFSCPFICSLSGSSLYCVYSALRIASIHGEIA